MGEMKVPSMTHVRVTSMCVIGHEEIGPEDPLFASFTEIDMEFWAIMRETFGVDPEINGRAAFV